MLFFIFSSEMLKMMCFALLCSHYLMGLTDESQEQEKLKLLNLLHDPTPLLLKTLSHTDLPVAVSVGYKDLGEISSSVVMAERWLRIHVLTHFPAIQITTIVVGDTVLCNMDQEAKWGVVLPSVKNIYHSLVRWGLEKEIKVSAAFSSECLHPFSDRFRDDLAERTIKPLLNFLQNSNSTYSVNPSSGFSPSLVSSHEESIKKLGFFNLNEINVIISIPKGKKPLSRKLSFLNSNVLNPFPARSTTFGFSVPPQVAKNPFPPLAQNAPPPSISLSFAPKNPPIVVPSNPPDALTFPPCNLSPAMTPTLRTEAKGLWCVAKPSVPADTLQEALVYACAEGGADCEEIRTHGSCYYPNTMVAHASYAFNSFWQKNKNNGGTCSFGGTAMIINADPSYLHCRFILN